MRVSPDSEWVVSASKNRVMKCWSATNCREVFSVKLNMLVEDFCFDHTSLYVAALGKCTNGNTKVAMFMLVGR